MPPDGAISARMGDATPSAFQAAAEAVGKPGDRVVARLEPGPPTPTTKPVVVK